MVVGAWTAVIDEGRSVAVAFCCPKLGFRDPRRSEAQEKAMGHISEEKLYLGQEAASQLIHAFPFVFKVDADAV